MKEDYPVCQNEVPISVNCWYLPLNVICADSLIQRYKLAIKLGRIAAFNNVDELSPFQNGANCHLGRIVAWDELSLFGICDELSLFTNGTNCRLFKMGRLTLGTNCRFL